MKEKPAIGHSIQNMFVYSDRPSSLSRKRPRDAHAKENDMVDIIYEKVYKIKEIKAFYSGQAGPAIYPLPCPLPVVPVDPVFGFRTHVCVNCLTAPIDPVRFSDIVREGSRAFRSIHVCRQEDMEIKRRGVENGVIVDVIKSWDKLRSSAIEFIANIFHQWYGPQNDVHILVVEAEDSSFVSEELLPINLGTIANNHWIYRALGNTKGTVPIDERELMEFINLAKGTFALFRVKVRNEEKNLYASLVPRSM
jgi:hypothetical protein